jgi:hypothetical protein
MSYRDIARRRVEQFATDSSATGCWARIRRQSVAQGLLARIQNPNLISQRGTPTCAPASFMRAIASSKPHDYATFVINLFKYGYAYLNDLNVTADQKLRRIASPGNCHDADWIPLSSIRNSDNVVFSMASDWSRSIAGITMPSSLADWMRRAGFIDVREDTYISSATKPIPTAVALNLSAANRRYNQGYKVMLFINADLLDADEQDNSTVIPNHWVALAGPISDGGVVSYDSNLRTRVWSWGSEYDIPVRSSKPITKREFLSKYFGHVAGRF